MLYGIISDLANDQRLLQLTSQSVKGGAGDERYIEDFCEPFHFRKTDGGQLGC